jgi:hypothetical protein
MLLLSGRIMKTKSVALWLSLSLSLSFFLSGALTCQAQAPSPTCPPAVPAPTPCRPDVSDCTGGSTNEDVDTVDTSEPQLVPIPQAFQPTDGTVLKWRRFVPDPVQFPGKRPVVLVYHVGGWKTGGTRDPGVEQVCRDFVAKGYLALAATYRLAPCGLIEGQHIHDDTPEGIASGRPEEQTHDVQAEVTAARVDDLGNGWVGVVGGSAGGTHAAVLAFNKTPTPNNDWPHWCQNGKDDRPNAVAVLSGCFDFSDRRDRTDQFVSRVENYSNLCERADQLVIAPVSFVKPESAQSFVPMILVNSDGDPMPYAQILDAQCAFQTNGIDPAKYQAITIVNSSLHAFEYWRTFDGPGSQTRIRDDVYNWFQSHM